MYDLFNILIATDKIKLENNKYHEKAKRVFNDIALQVTNND